MLITKLTSPENCAMRPKHLVLTMWVCSYKTSESTVELCMTVELAVPNQENKLSQMTGSLALF